MFQKLTVRFLRIAFIFLLTGITAISYSQNIQGSVTDAKTGEPLAGATVHLDKTKYSTIANLDGSYIFKNIQPGTYEIAVSLAGYNPPRELQIQVSEHKNVKAPDFKMEPSVTTLNEVVVIHWSFFTFPASYEIK